MTERTRNPDGTFGIEHGFSYDKVLSNIWYHLRNRCVNPKDEKYPRYGGRGITISWKSFEEFARWAVVSGYQPGLQIDRKDNNGPYSPDNCRFVTSLVNNNNRASNRHLTAFGETKTIAEWGRDPRCGVAVETLRYRIKRGKLSPESALTHPLMAS